MEYCSFYFDFVRIYAKIMVIIANPQGGAVMVSAFDLEKLSGLLRDFYEITHLRITVFDENLNELISYPDDVAPYCRVIRDTPEGLQACMACDRKGCTSADKKRRTHIYRCHAGFTEAVTPLYDADILVGYLLFGHVFSYSTHKEGWEVIQDRCVPLSADMDALQKAVFDAVPIPEAFVRSAAHILHAVASYLILERMASLKEDLLASRLDAFISAHYTEKLTASSLCRSLGIGKTQLYQLSGQLYGQGIAAHIRALRIKKAKVLLTEQPNLPLIEIASRCGYKDYNYFFTVFARETGSSPGEWRKSRR